MCWHNVFCPVVGAMMSPETPGSGYVLLHHVMGELEGVKGAWGYVEGGMGAVSAAIANCARDHGASIFTSQVWVKPRFKKLHTLL